MLTRNIKLLGIPFTYGQDKSGVRLAADVLRKYGLVDMLNELAPTKDLGDLGLNVPKSDLAYNGIKNEVESAIASQRISKFIEREDLEESFLLNIGGDHGMGLGVLHGLLHQRPDMVVIWADAHGDINTPESSPSGNFHGMPLSFLLEGAQNREVFEWLSHRLPANKLILFGPRSLDAREKEIIEKLSIQYYSSEEINRRGSSEIIKQALAKADPEGKCPIHLSLDIDFFDSEDVISTGTRESQGPEFEEVFFMGRALSETGRLCSMDIVELNPEIGTWIDVDATFQTAIDFVRYTLNGCFRNNLNFNSKTQLEYVQVANY